MSVGATSDRIASEKSGTGFISRVSPVQVRPPLVQFDSVQIDHEPAEVHHSRPGVSASQLKTLATSPAEYYHRYVGGEVSHRKSAALEYGTLLHLWAELGEERFWDEAKQYPEKVLTATGQLGKEAKSFAAEQPEGTILVTPTDWRNLYGQTRQLLANSAVTRLIDATIDREFNCQWTWNGHACRCRTDAATESCWFDWKTTRESDPKRRAFSIMREWHYGIQAAFYGEAAALAGWPRHSMRFILTSTTSHLCCVVYLPMEQIEAERRRCLLLMEELKQRTEWNQWVPSYYGEEFEIEVPNWAKEVE